MFDFGISWLRGVLCDPTDIFGGESFLQLIAGTNFVFFAFRELDPRKGALIQRVKDIRDGTVLTIKDGKTLELANWLTNTLCGMLKHIHDLLWSTCRPMALIAGLIGVFFLFIGVHGICTIVLAVPLGVYLAACIIGTTGFSIFCRILTMQCKTNPPDVESYVEMSKAALKREISESDDDRQWPR